MAYVDRYSDRDEAAMLVYIFKRAYWGRGLATELAREALAAAFGDPRVPAVFATVKPANAASIRVLEKCGLSRRECPPCTDRLLYRITRAEWEGLSKNPPG